MTSKPNWYFERDKAAMAECERNRAPKPDNRVKPFDMDVARYVEALMSSAPDALP